ncbi:hypothetical protein R6Q59_010284, partial [Mikania micrantha]
MATHIGRGHGGDGGDRPSHGDPYRLPTSCEAYNLRNRKGVQKENITILKKIEKNHCKPLPIEVEEEGEQYKFVEENFSCFIRLISNEVRKVATFHYTSWENVSDQSKKAIIPTLF